MATVNKPNGTARSTESIGGDPDFFTVYTLVDITDTGISDSRATPVKPYNQAQNLNSLIQCVSLRVQPNLISVDKLVGEAMADHEFGSAFTGTQTVWVLKFATERSGYTDENKLKTDVDGLPVLTGMDETATLSTAVFNSLSNTNKNIYFIQHTTL